MSDEQLEEMGPIDYMVLEWARRAAVTGEASRDHARPRGPRASIRILDIAFIAKDADGSVDGDRLRRPRRGRRRLRRVRRRVVRACSTRRTWRRPARVLEPGTVGRRARVGEPLGRARRRRAPPLRRPARRQRPHPRPGHPRRRSTRARPPPPDEEDDHARTASRRRPHRRHRRHRHRGQQPRVAPPGADVGARARSPSQQRAAARRRRRRPPPAAPAAPDPIEQLKQLAELKHQGILTDEEFAAEKAKILGS